VLFGHSGVSPAALRTVKLSPSLPIRLFRKTCTIRKSGRLFSACERPHTPRAASRLGRRANRISHRIGKDPPHCPDILSLRQDCPSLASVSGISFLLDGTSALWLRLAETEPILFELTDYWLLTTIPRGHPRPGEAEGHIVNCESVPGQMSSLSVSSYSPQSMRAIHYVPFRPPGVHRHRCSFA
jgi:hypothetical protein